MIRQPKERIIHLASQVDQKSINDVTSRILDINKDDSELEKLFDVYGQKYERNPIQLFIDSYGGYVYQCLGLLGVIRSSKTPIHTIATGAAMSCGFMILICGHKRFAYKYATPMYHQISSWEQGTVQAIKEGLEETERLQTLIETLTLEKTRISAERLKEVREKKLDWYMSAEDALKHGVIDEMVS